jgi:hypothetical protein
MTSETAVIVIGVTIVIMVIGYLLRYRFMKKR